MTQPAAAAVVKDAEEAYYPPYPQSFMEGIVFNVLLQILVKHIEFNKDGKLKSRMHWKETSVDARQKFGILVHANDLKKHAV